MNESKHTERILLLLFDGKCNYCNRWVNFVIKHDKKKNFRFAALQSDAGKKLLSEFKIPEEEDSVVLIVDNNVYLKSSAGLRIMKHIQGIYSILYIFIIVPPFIRNFFYNIIARNRYNWWVKREECMMPAEQVKDRFL